MGQARRIDLFSSRFPAIGSEPVPLFNRLLEPLRPYECRKQVNQKQHDHDGRQPRENVHVMSFQTLSQAGKQANRMANVAKPKTNIVGNQIMRFI
jgi:hypothetical protein